jgi:hypothetical protein
MGFGPQTGQLFGARMSDPEHIEILRRGPRATLGVHSIPRFFRSWMMWRYPW